MNFQQFRTIHAFLKKYLLDSDFYGLVDLLLARDLVVKLGRFLGIPYFIKAHARLRNLKMLLDPFYPLLVFDIGANVGDMAATYARAGLKVIAVEPDPLNLRRLSKRFRFNTAISIIPYGIGRTRCQLLLNRYSKCRAHDTFSEKRKQRMLDLENPALGISVPPTDQVLVSLISLDDLIAEYGVPDYVKIDVEGFEKEVLSGLSHPIKVLSFECCLPDFLEESIACVEILDNLSNEYCYNFFDSSHNLALQSLSWLSAPDIIRLLSSGSYSFMEIVAVLNFPALC